MKIAIVNKVTLPKMSDATLVETIEGMEDLLAMNRAMIEKWGPDVLAVPEDDLKKRHAMAMAELEKRTA